MEDHALVAHCLRTLGVGVAIADPETWQERVEKLLLNVMPRAVYEDMKDYGTTTPQRFEAASVLMLDFVGFTEMAISQDPRAIGDAYVAVSGLPEPNMDHATNIAKVALRTRRYLERRNAAHPTQWRCRIGVATGPLIGSLVGIQKYVYDIFGPAVNLAARLEQLSAPMEITVSEQTWRTVRDDFVFAERGAVAAKGFGIQTLHTLEDERRERR